MICSFCKLNLFVVKSGYCFLCDSGHLICEKCQQNINSKVCPLCKNEVHKMFPV